jgi:hypothetical protein
MRLAGWLPGKGGKHQQNQPQTTKNGPKAVFHLD